jgi:hypothetical protein
VREIGRHSCSGQMSISIRIQSYGHCLVSTRTTEITSVDQVGLSLSPRVQLHDIRVAQITEQGAGVARQHWTGKQTLKGIARDGKVFRAGAARDINAAGWSNGDVQCLLTLR